MDRGCFLAEHVFQTGNFHDGALGIGAVDGLAGMAQSGLSEPLGHSGHFGHLGPRVAVGVQGHSSDPQTLTALLEFGGSVTGSNRCQIWEKRTRVGQRAQDRFTTSPKPDAAQLGRFLAVVADGAVSPIDVPGLKGGDVGAGPAEIPAELIEGPALRVGFPVEDPAVFFFGDGPFGLVTNFGPAFLGQNGFGQPTEIEGEVLEPAEVGVGGNGPGVHRSQKLIGPGPEQGQFQQTGHRTIFARDLDAVPGGRSFGVIGGVGVDDVFPGSGGRIRIDAADIGHAHAVGTIRGFSALAVGLVEAFGLLLVLGLEACLAATEDVLNIEGAIGTFLEEAIAAGGIGRVHGTSFLEEWPRSG